MQVADPNLGDPRATPITFAAHQAINASIDTLNAKESYDIREVVSLQEGHIQQLLIAVAKLERQVNGRSL